MTAAAEFPTNGGSIRPLCRADGDLIAAILLFTKGNADLNALDHTRQSCKTIQLRLHRSGLPQHLLRNADPCNLSVFRKGKRIQNLFFDCHARFRLGIEQRAVDCGIIRARFYQFRCNTMRARSRIGIFKAAAVRRNSGIQAGGDLRRKRNAHCRNHCV